MHRLLVLGAILLGQSYLQDSKISSVADVTQTKEGKQVASTEVIPGGEITIQDQGEFATILPEEEEGAGAVERAIADAEERIKQVTSDILTSEEGQRATEVVEGIKEKAAEALAGEEEQPISQLAEKKEEYVGPEIESGITSDDIKKLRAEVEKELTPEEKIASIEQPSVFEEEVEPEEVLIGEAEVKDQEKLKEAVEELKISKEVAAVEEIVKEPTEEMVAKKEVPEVSEKPVLAEEKKEVAVAETEEELIQQKKIISSEEAKKIAKVEEKPLPKEQEKAVSVALEESQKEAEEMYLTEDEEMEVLLGLSQEEDVYEFDVPDIVPKKKVSSRRFVNENVPGALLSLERSLDNRHIPLVFAKQDMVRLAFVAIKEDDTAKLRSIVKDLKDPDIFNEQNGETALTYAIKNGSHNTMKFLIYYGADVNKSNNKLETPVYLAVKSKDEVALNMLIENSADLDTKDIFKKTPLMIAVETEQPNVIKNLVEGGANINLMNARGETALDIAEKYDIKQVVLYLLSKGAIGSQKASIK